MKFKQIFLILSCAVVACNQEKKVMETEVSTKDPYIWLEEVESEKSLEWVKKQNEKSDKAITTNPLYTTLTTELLTAFDDTDKIATPTIVGDYVYNLWQDEHNARGVWRRMPLADYLAKKDVWEVVLDIDALSEKENKKWVFKGAKWLAPSYQRCMLTLSNGGTDKSEQREFDAVSKTFVNNGFYLPPSKGSSTWLDENTLLIAPGTNEEDLTVSGYPRVMQKWKRGTEMAAATTVFKGDTTLVGTWAYSYYVKDKYIGIVAAMESMDDYTYYLLKGEEVKKIDIPNYVRLEDFFNGELLLFVQKNWKVAGNTIKAGTLVSLNLEAYLKGTMAVTTVYVPNEKSSYVELTTSKDFFVINTMQNVQNQLYKCYAVNGSYKLEEVNTPPFGSIFLGSSSGKENGYFFYYSNLITPTALYYGGTNELAVVKQQKADFNTSNLTIEQLEATSKDGTVVPYFIVHNKNIVYNGANPTLQYAYGGFNISEQPYYSSYRGIGWLAQGGVYVLANIRGGGEFGPQWHKDAMRDKRQNAYDDFFAVSEDLIKRKITSPKYLGAFGWSNGGLLAGVVLTQRPDLYNAVVVGAPLLDMKRFNKMLAGASWMGEYGNPDVEEDWAYLQKFSPYHNVFADKEYPEAFFVTSTKDDRVHPAHARKMVARMLEQGHSVFYHETLEGGHGAASTNLQRAEMWAMVFTYLNMKLNIKA